MTEPKVGVYVIETLTTGMYTNPLDCLREYVQNAFDSVREASRVGLLDAGRGRIEVIIEPADRSVVIRDNGTGIDRGSFVERMLNIGMSRKSVERDAGFRGIGRLAGIAYCTRLVFRTTIMGEPVVSSLAFDCDALRALQAPDQRQERELTEVLRSNAHISQDKIEPDARFFEVRMEGILSQFEDFLRWEVLEPYLAQVAPVDFDSHTFIHAPTIKEWAKKHGLVIPTATLVISAPGVQRQVFKPYKTHYKTRRGARDGGGYDVHIRDVCFFPENPSPDSPFWVWYGVSDLLGQLEDSQAAGLRIRKSNISLGGPERVAELFSTLAESNGRFNAYFIGEIHVNSAKAVPNARRDGLEDVGDWPLIKDSLLELIQKLSEDVRHLSQERNRPTAKVLRGADTVLKEAAHALTSGMITKAERRTIVDKLEKQRSRLEATIKSRPDDPAVTEMTSVLADIQRTMKDVTDGNDGSNIKRSDLDRKQRKLLTTILETLHGVLDEASFLKAKSAIMVALKMTESEPSQ